MRYSSRAFSTSARPSSPSSGGVGGGHVAVLLGLSGFTAVEAGLYFYAPELWNKQRDMLREKLGVKPTTLLAPEVPVQSPTIEPVRIDESLSIQQQDGDDVVLLIEDEQQLNHTETQMVEEEPVVEQHVEEEKEVTLVEEQPAVVVTIVETTVVEENTEDHCGHCDDDDTEPQQPIDDDVVVETLVEQQNDEITSSVEPEVDTVLVEAQLLLSTTLHQTKLELLSATEQVAALTLQLEETKKEADRRIRIERAITVQDMEAERELAIQSRLEIERAAMALRMKDQLEEKRVEIEKELNEYAEREVTKIYDMANAAATERAQLIKRHVDVVHELKNEVSRFIVREYKMLNAFKLSNASFEFSTAVNQPVVSDTINIKSAIEELKDASGKVAFVEDLLNTIPDEVVQKGVPTRDYLNAEFEQLSKQCLELELVPQESGAVWYALGKVLALVAKPREKSLEEGDTADAVFSRAGFKLDHDDLEGAIQELKSLKGEYASMSEQWIMEASSRATVVGVASAIHSQSRIDATKFERMLNRMQ